MLQPTQPAPELHSSDREFLHNADSTGPVLTARGPPVPPPFNAQPETSQTIRGIVGPGEEHHEQARAESLTSDNSGSNITFRTAAESLPGQSDYQKALEEQLEIDAGGLENMLQQTPPTAYDPAGRCRRQMQAAAPTSASGSSASTMQHSVHPSQTTPKSTFERPLEPSNLTEDDGDDKSLDS